MNIYNGTEEEKNKNNSLEKFGKVIDALHKESKLPSLRTYQGDMAEFIKNKDESVVSIAVKEKERQREKAKQEEKLEILQKSVPGEDQNFKRNVKIISLSLLLIGGGILAFFYVFKLMTKGPVIQPVVNEEIIPDSGSVTLTGVTDKNLGSKLAEATPGNGISVFKIAGANGPVLPKAGDFLNFMNISLPGALQRALKDQYELGVISQNGEKSYFIVMTVDDFGRAFSGMLDWEENMPKDLAFLDPTGTATSAESLAWKDIIIKNKDTRAFANEKDQTKIVYTFLDKNTILIVNNLLAVADLSSAYASRSVVR